MLVVSSGHRSILSFLLLMEMYLTGGQPAAWVPPVPRAASVHGTQQSKEGTSSKVEYRAGSRKQSSKSGRERG